MRSPPTEEGRIIMYLFNYIPVRDSSALKQHLIDTWANIIMKLLINGETGYVHAKGRHFEHLLN